MKRGLSYPLELLELPPSEEVPLVSALVANQNYAHYVGEAPTLSLATMSLLTLTQHGIARRYNGSCGGRLLLRKSEVLAQVRWTVCQKWRRRATRCFRP